MPLKQGQQNIVIKMLSNGHKVTYFDQNIYPNFRVFLLEMHDLEKRGAVTVNTIKRDGKFVVEFSLTKEGEAYAKLLEFFNKDIRLK